ncbi:MAG TPA: hypothetical protein PKY40_14180, partial [Burkholderiaceae bacterium]|nr:hypothetical protein [Burkholderiaceae bacterium]
MATQERFFGCISFSYRLPGRGGDSLWEGVILDGKRPVPGPGTLFGKSRGFDSDRIEYRKRHCQLHGRFFIFLTFHAKIRRTFLSGSVVGTSISTRLGRPLISNRVIRVGSAIALPTILRECGIDADALIAQIGLPVAVFDHPDNVIPFAKLGELAHL